MCVKIISQAFKALSIHLHKNKLFVTFQIHLKMYTGRLHDKTPMRYAQMARKHARSHAKWQ